MDSQILHIFPTRRSSNLKGSGLKTHGADRRTESISRAAGRAARRGCSGIFFSAGIKSLGTRGGRRGPLLDRKSTRLNSSHLGISYAVFCLQKKKHKSTVT